MRKSTIETAENAIYRLYWVEIKTAGSSMCIWTNISHKNKGELILSYGERREHVRPSMGTTRIPPWCTYLLSFLFSFVFCFNISSADRGKCMCAIKLNLILFSQLTFIPARWKHTRHLDSQGCQAWLNHRNAINIMTYIPIFKIRFWLETESELLPLPLDIISGFFYSGLQRRKQSLPPYCCGSTFR